MKFRNLILGIMFSALIIGCEKEKNLGTPDLTLGNDKLSFEKEEGTQTVTINATRDWTVKSDADWLTVSPASGKASTDPVSVEISVLANDGMDRNATVEFSIGMVSKTLTVTQKGAKGSLDDLIVYYNDFDKELAKENEGWPYLDEFDGWKNQTGTGASSVEYAHSGVSARSNATSNSNYSDYAGSGNNNLFFGRNAYFIVKNIALGSDRDYTISFGTEKYLMDADNTFNPEEFHVYVSNDGLKWVELKYDFPNGYKNGRWDQASSTFTLPEGTSNLSIYVCSDLASAHRMDDLKLLISDKAGTEIDFAKGVELGGGVSGSVTTIADAIVAGNGTKAELSDVLVMALYGNGLIVGDGKDYILVYEKKMPEAKVGDKVTVKGEIATYQSVKQIANPDVTVVSSGNPVEHPEPEVIDGVAMDNYKGDKVAYVKYSGLLTKESVDGKYYYNVKVSSAAKVSGSISYPVQEIDSYIGKNVTVEGYYMNITNQGKSFATVLVSIVEAGAVSSSFSVSPLELTFPVSGGKAVFNIEGNVEWTIESSDSHNFTVDKSSGEGNSQITVAATENTSGEDRNATITVSTTADVETKTYEVALRQTADASQGNESVLDLSSIEASLGEMGTGSYGDYKDVVKTGTVNGIEIAATNVCANSKDGNVKLNAGQFIQIQSGKGYIANTSSVNIKSLKIYTLADKDADFSKTVISVGNEKDPAEKASYTTSVEKATVSGYDGDVEKDLNVYNVDVSANPTFFKVSSTGAIWLYKIVVEY